MEAVQKLLTAPPAGCAFAAMVLGSIPGRSNAIEGEPLVPWQHGQIARHGLKSVIWLPPSVDVNRIHDAPYRALVDKVQPARDADAGAWPPRLRR